MTADIVNLRRARKAKARGEHERLAAENRVRFGRSKAERQAQSIASERERRAHLGNELERRQELDGARDADASGATGEDASAKIPGEP